MDFSLLESSDLNLILTSLKYYKEANDKLLSELLKDIKTPYINNEVLREIQKVIEDYRERIDGINKLIIRIESL